MKQIKIKNETYNVKYTIRALFIWERIMDKPFEVKSLLDTYMLYFSMILANNPDKPLQWDEFLTAIDEDPKLFQELSVVLSDAQDRADMLDEAQAETGNAKKKQK